MNIAPNHVAAFQYTLKDDDGNVLDSSEGGAPLSYVHGTQAIIPGLERALDGKAVGDKIEVRIAPEDAYGERDDRMVQQVARAQLPPGVELELGMQLQAESTQGRHIVTIVAMEGDQVTLDANHPLAGVPLNFEVEVVEVREATPEELEQSQAQGPGGAAQ